MMTTAPPPALEFVAFNDLVNWSVRYLRENRSRYRNTFPLARIGDFLKRNRHIIQIQDEVLYARVTIRLYTKGVLKRDEEWGRNIGTKRQFVVAPGQFIMSKIDARNGAFGLVPPDLDGAVTTADFLSYDVDTSRINPAFLTLVSSTKEFLSICQNSSSGTTGRQRVDETQFLNIKIPLPSLEEQDRIVAAYNARITEAERLIEGAEVLQSGIKEYLFASLGLQAPRQKVVSKGLQFIPFQSVSEWSINRILGQLNFSSSKYEVTSLEENPNLTLNVFRGKSPVYQINSGYFILNQKCVRWSVVDKQYSKEVSKEWIEKIEQENFTLFSDILINSTGEGTIGRSAIVNEDQVGLLYDSHVLCLRLNKSIISPKYFMYLFNSEYGQAQVNSIKSAQSTKQTELGINNLIKVLFPLPSIDIQNKIVDKLDSWNFEIENLRKNKEIQFRDSINDFEAELFAS